MVRPEKVVLGPILLSKKEVGGYVSSGGTLCFKIDELEPFFNDFDAFREAFINKLGI